MALYCKTPELSAEPAPTFPDPIVDEIDGNQDANEVDPITVLEVFNLIRNINDPEHPTSLQQLNVVNQDDIHVSGNRILVEFTPTIPHCSMATLIGLSIKVMLIVSLPLMKVVVKVKEGTHQSEGQVNKQLADKERVMAALENSHLLGVVNQALKTCL